MILKDPLFFVIGVFIIVSVVWYKTKKSKTFGVRFSSVDIIPEKVTWRLLLDKNLIYLRAVALLFVFFAFARPQSPIEESKVSTQGIDIVLAVDVSTSMLAEDFMLKGQRVNRLAAVKDVVTNFINQRSGDRIGLVTFAGQSYTACPLTLDYTWLLENLERVEIGMVEDGTAIGDGLITALNRLKNTPTKEKIIILLTDGRNNAGKIAPIVAAEAAKALEIKVYTVGAGTKGLAPYPAQDFWGRKVYQSVQIDIDEDTLNSIAEKTYAAYYRATDTSSLRNIYNEIDKLEKTKIEQKGYTDYHELFPWFLGIGLMILLGEIILRNTLLFKLP